MSREFPESDWKVFRQLREIALQRFCEAVLVESREAASDTSKSAHERYLDLYRIFQRRDRELGEAFDNPRRSTAMIQLVVIHSRGLLEPVELARFTDATRNVLSELLGDGKHRASPPNKPVHLPAASRRR